MFASKIQSFREKLELTINILEEKDNPPEQLVLAIVRGLLSDFNQFFPKEFWGKNKYEIEEGINKYCYKNTDVCPICESKLREINIFRNSLWITFKGCTEYPKCHGSRDLQGRPIINDHMIMFITMKKLEEEGQVDRLQMHIEAVDLDD